MGNGWGKVILRFGMMAVAVIIIGLLVIDHRQNMAEQAKHKVLFIANARTNGWTEDKFLGKQYQVFYPGTIGRPALDWMSFRELYKALGSDPLAEPLNSGCSLLFKDEPKRVILSIMITPEKAVLTISGKIDRIDVERMTETLLDMASMVDVRAKGIASITQGTDGQLQRWECKFEFAE